MRLSYYLKLYRLLWLDLRFEYMYIYFIFIILNCLLDCYNYGRLEKRYSRFKESLENIMEKLGS